MKDNTVKCPNCKEVFKVDDSVYTAIVKQVRDQQFDDEINSRIQAEKKAKESALKTAELELSNKFQIPTISNAKKYKLDLGFPEDLKTDETQEFIIVLATKTKFAILNQIKVSQLLTRLDEITKPNWYMQKIGYSVLRRK